MCGIIFKPQDETFLAFATGHNGAPGCGERNIQNSSTKLRINTNSNYSKCKTSWNI
ncbi:MAG TPA: hypothetical protein DCO77_09270 [Nitrospiraceae bacterium]|nr:hypothetical protein [Nitrospiraceae bacterium]